MTGWRALILACVGLAMAPLAAFAQATADAAKGVTLDLPGRAIAFRIMAERLPLKNDKGKVDAQAGILALVRSDAAAMRPVTFVIGGGPGTSSAYLNLGAIGPWRIALDAAPSAPNPLTPNADTWLDFTDLVFVDPPGTGQGIFLSQEAKTKERIWSVGGDIDGLSDVIADWLRRSGRLAAPKILLGQSYGGFRTPLIAESLQQRHGVALNALILVSPILDHGWRYHARSSPLSFATLLPSFAAARMEQDGNFDPHRLASVEDYASAGFIEDFLRGLRDREALARLTDKVIAITGLPAEVVTATRGRVDEKLFSREWARRYGKVTSSYDASVTGDDPDPSTPRPDFADPFLARLKAPLTVAMSGLLKAHAGTQTPAYVVANDTVFEDWHWNTDHGLPESVTALRKMLALDPALRVLVVHGTADLQTPYFESTLILNQLPDFDGRVAQRNYRGGHLFYSRDESRAAFRKDAEALFSGIARAP